MAQPLNVGGQKRPLGRKDTRAGANKDSFLEMEFREAYIASENGVWGMVCRPGRTEEGQHVAASGWGGEQDGNQPAGGRAEAGGELNES